MKNKLSYHEKYFLRKLFCLKSIFQIQFIFYKQTEPKLQYVCDYRIWTRIITTIIIVNLYDRNMLR